MGVSVINSLPPPATPSFSLSFSLLLFLNFRISMCTCSKPEPKFNTVGSQTATNVRRQINISQMIMQRKACVGGPLNSILNINHIYLYINRNITRYKMVHEKLMYRIGRQCRLITKIDIHKRNTNLTMKKINYWKLQIEIVIQR